jgi:TniQ
MGRSRSRRPRPLARSLEPLAGESLAGYLLRLSCRLGIGPLELARLTGCADGNSSAVSRHLLLTLDVQRFAQVTRLPSGAATSLTIVSWAGRYPPVTRSRTGQGPPVILDNWLFAVTPRFCPGCLAGDGSPIQQQYGGPWKKTWQLPVAFACPLHRRFLREACPEQHPARPGIGTLITFPGATALHPAQCRTPLQPHNKGPGRPACGSRLDQPGDDDLHRPGQAALDTQQRLLGLLSPAHPAEDASRTFTDLRLISALLCMSWPLGRDLMDARPAAEVDNHVSRLSGGARPKSLDTQPASLLATAGLLTAAVTVLDSPDLAGTVARHVQDRTTVRPSRSAWARVIERHHSACSPAMREAADSATRAYRRISGPHSPKAPARASTYRPEHVPALLEQRWHDEHLASFGYQGATTMRRAGSVLLVQWASGGSLGDAARYLGIRTGRSQHSFGPELARWLRDHGSKDFIDALLSLAAQLDDTPGLVNYQNRRQAMQGWCLDPGTWQELTSHLPPVPGPVQPVLDDRKRQEASAFVWAHVTQGEPRFAPRPIEASQPDPVREDWTGRRGNLWHKLTRPGRFVHYIELRKLLIEYGDCLATDIDNKRLPGGLPGLI